MSRPWSSLPTLQATKRVAPVLETSGTVDHLDRLPSLEDFYHAVYTTATILGHMLELPW